jgi:hypothetical protein
MAINLKFIAITFILAMASVASAQTRWKNVDIDAICSIALPQNFTEAGESFEKSYEAKAAHGIVSVTKLRHQNVQTLTLQDLRIFYKAYADSVAKGAEVTFSDPRVRRNGLLGYRFRYRSEDDPDTEVDIIVVLIKDICYTFQYSSTESLFPTTQAERKRLFGSIYFRSVKPSEQFTEEIETKSAVVGEKLGYALRYLLIAMALTIITLILFGKLKVAVSVKQVSALLFIGAGALNLVLYIINKLMDQPQRIMFVLGLFYLVFGVVLIFVRLPKPDPEDL